MTSYSVKLHESCAQCIDVGTGRGGRGALEAHAPPQTIALSTFPTVSVGSGDIVKSHHHTSYMMH